MNNNIKKIRIGLVFVVLIFAALLFSAWLCFEKIVDNYKNIVSAKSALSFSKIQEQEIKSFKEKYQSYLPNLQKIDRAIVDSKNPLDLIEFLEDSAAENNIVLQLSPLFLSEKPGLKPLPVQISARGEFNDILAFLDKIEYSRFLFSIYNLSFEYVRISKTDPESGSRIIQANITANILAK